MADQDHRDAPAFGKGHQLLRRRPHLRHRPRRAVHGIQPHRLDRIDDRQSGTLGIQRGQDVAQSGLGPQPHRRIRQPQPQRPHPHLCRGLFARDIDATQPGPRKTGRRLQQQRRLADTGIAPHKDRRPRHQAAAQHPVQFRQTRRHTRRRRLGGGKVGQRDGCAACPQRFRPGCQRHLFADGIPRPAGIAAPRPFAMHGTAGRTGKGGGGFGHAPACPKAYRPASQTSPPGFFCPQISRGCGGWPPLLRVSPGRASPNPALSP